ncbi:MAG: hypothetical protein RMK99_11545 [Anaerolineales bacterium]|nr:hypothetical protein [Anaerolineales bacterium]
MHRLKAEHKRLLRALAEGHTLKAHRDIEGHKEFRLHFSDGRPSEPVERRHPEELVEAGLIDSNKKFPAATFWLTERGRAVAAELLQEAGPR